MHEIPHRQDEPDDVAPPRRRRWQFGLRTSFLLVAAIAVWLTYFLNRAHNAATAARIAVMSPLARELIIDDAGKIAVVKMEELWFDENRWEIHLPKGRQYRLCMATRGIDENGLAKVAKSEPIEAGRHQVALEMRADDAGNQITATWDDGKRLTIQEPKEWDPGSGSSGGGEYASSTQIAADEPVILFRRRFMQKNKDGSSSTPKGPTEGILLWIATNSLTSEARPPRPRQGP